MSDQSGHGEGGLGARAKELGRQGQQAAGGVADAVLEQTRVHPYPALAAAFGVGYALGGGLFSPTTGRLLRLGLKLAVLPQVQTVLLDLAEAALDGALAQGRKLTADGPPAAAPAPGAPQA